MRYECVIYFADLTIFYSNFASEKNHQNKDIIMKTTKKLITLLLLALMTANMAVAFNFEVDGIYYKINGSEVTVTYKSRYSGDYSGDIVIPERVTYQGVTYTVTAIGDNAFYWCSDLASIHIPKSIKRIQGNMTFYACPNLSVVEIESLESWCNIDFEISPGYNFSYSNPLSYSHSLYMNGEKLTELVIPSGATRIGTSAFCKLSSLSRLEIPSSMISIGDAAFIGCSGFDRLDIPDLESFIKIDFQGNESNPMIHARQIYLDGIEMSHELVIPETATTISEGAFNGCQYITSVSIPPSVKTIGANAFSNCDSLKRVYIQDIASWCKIVFANSGANPISNTIPKAWWDFQKVDVYVNGSSVTHLVIPEGVTHVGNYAFVGAPFDHVSFPNTVGSIGDAAFYHSRLEEVILPESIESLGTSAFRNCESLKKAEINAGLEVIPESAFFYCTDLNDVTLPSSVKKIDKEAFYACRSLSTMPMTDSLQIIEENAFTYSGIEYLKTGKSLTSIGNGAFACCNWLKRVEIDDQVTSIGDDAFGDCYSLQNVIVGNGVQKIPNRFCYSSDNLTCVTLGNAVDTLETECFLDSEQLDTIICKAVVPPVMNGEENSFFHSAVFQNATLYVPRSSILAYKSSPVWEKFQNIQGMDNGIIPGDVNGDGEINIQDANSVIDIVVMGGNSGHSRAPAADVNDDGEINIADVNAIIDIIQDVNGQ